MKKLLLLLLLMSFVLIACTRSAATPPSADSGSEGEPTEELPFTVPTEMPNDLATTISLTDFATQTAKAAGDQGGLVLATATPIPIVPQDTPAGEQPIKPTKTTKPTKEPVSGCQSPYTVKKGDWVYNIGRRCNIHPDSIIQANNLKWPYTIYPGDQLILPKNAPAFPGP